MRTTFKRTALAVITAIALLLGTACGDGDSDAVDSDSQADIRSDLSWDLVDARNAVSGLGFQLDDLVDALDGVPAQAEAIELRDRTGQLRSRLLDVSILLTDIDRAVEIGEIDWAEAQWADMVNRGDTLLEQQPELLLGQIEALADQLEPVGGAINPRLRHSVSEARQDLAIVVNALAGLSGSPKGAG